MAPPKISMPLDDERQTVSNLVAMLQDCKVYPKFVVDQNFWHFVMPKRQFFWRMKLQKECLTQNHVIRLGFIRESKGRRVYGTSLLTFDEELMIQLRSDAICIIKEGKKVPYVQVTIAFQKDKGRRCPLLENTTSDEKLQIGVVQFMRQDWKCQRLIIVEQTLIGICIYGFNLYRCLLKIEAKFPCKGIRKNQVVGARDKITKKRQETVDGSTHDAVFLWNT